MESIAQTSNNALLPVDASPVEMRRDAARFPRVCTMTREDAIAQMLGVVEAAALYRGRKLDADELGFTATALVDEILADQRWGLRYISFAEIRRAVRRAVLETEMYGVSVATLYKALVDYARGEGTAARNTIDAQTRRKTGAQILAEASAAEMITQQRKTQ